ncbi:hypothetical protein [Streptomyces sp. JJ38]|uniref:hypothetical protein n=1 Tax=Streptomyces sp. JJ38 TaxID=2738128 RepID=UPI001C55A01D|nr:hypothetical protein [Streptomyces sp. JJ38]MBW1599548.1 hypothetical protein [Streptomyces sp. JJ38]
MGERRAADLLLRPQLDPRTLHSDWLPRPASRPESGGDGPYDAGRHLTSRRMEPLDLSAPHRPTVAWLRRTAAADISTLSEQLDTVAIRDQEWRTTIWERLDAAMLLVDRDGDHRVDTDASPEALVAAIGLARCGWARLAGRDTYVREARTSSLTQVRMSDVFCYLNPMHGPGIHEVPGLLKSKGRLPVPGGEVTWRGGELQRSYWLCSSCRRGFEGRRLSVLALPVPGRRRRRSYREGVGVLSHAPEVGAVVKAAREVAGVR